MKWKAKHRLRARVPIVHKHELPTLHVKDYETKQACCQDCTHYRDQKCIAPCALCLKSLSRVDPWLRMPLCPTGRWAHVCAKNAGKTTASAKPLV